MAARRDEPDKIPELDLALNDDLTCCVIDEIALPVVIPIDFLRLCYRSCPYRDIHIYRLLHTQRLAPPECKRYRIQTCHRKCYELEFRLPVVSTTHRLSTGLGFVPAR